MKIIGKKSKNIINVYPRPLHAHDASLSFGEFIGILGKKKKTDEECKKIPKIKQD